MYISYRFVTGPSSINEPSLIGKSPKVYINYSTKPVSLYLVVYRALSATICLFVDSKYLSLSLLFFLNNRVKTLKLECLFYRQNKFVNRFL